MTARTAREAQEGRMRLPVFYAWATIIALAYGRIAVENGYRFAVPIVVCGFLLVPMLAVLWHWSLHPAAPSPDSEGRDGG